MTITPSPGVLLVKPVKAEEQWGAKKDTKIKRGSVIAVGADYVSEAGQQYAMSDYAKSGDIVDFLTYDGEYDQAYFEGQSYHYVKFQDLRGVVHANK